LRLSYGALVGHGYYPLLAGFWLAMAILAGSIIVATNRVDFVPNRDPANSAAIAYLQQTHNPIPTQTPLKPVNYTLSALLPTAVGNAASDWTVRADATWLSFGLTVLKLTAWVVTALLLAGVTGLLSFVLNATEPNQIGGYDNIFGVPVAQTTKCPSGTAIVLDTKIAVLAFMRQGIEIMFNQFGDYEFQHNAVQFRGEERVAIGCAYPAAVCVVTNLNQGSDWSS